MKQFFILLRASLSEGMDLFRIKKKKGEKSSGLKTTIALAALMFFVMWTYASSWFEWLDELGKGSLVLAFVITITTILTLIEGIYKSSSLLYNSKDDGLLLTLPISRRMIIALKLVKFYLFELAFNSMFLLPAMIVYFTGADVGLSFIPVSLLVLILAPVVPVVLSCIIGAIISMLSSRFKKRTAVQIIFTFIAMIMIMVASFMFSFSTSTDSNAGESLATISEAAAKVYYPAGLYEKMAAGFSILDLGIFVLIHFVVTGIGVLLLSKTYFDINTQVKASSYVVTKKIDIEKLEVRTRKPLRALIKKELGKFFGTPVFITNAGFGIIMFVIGVALLCWKFDAVVAGLESKEIPLSTEAIRGLAPIIAYALMSFSTLMTFITSSMISLEGKSINILKALPVSTTTVLRAKVIAAMIIVLPLILIGDIVMAVWLRFGILETILLLAGSVVLPAFMQMFGILTNLKYPMLDAENEMEAVKQSRSSMICAFVGMGTMGITIGALIGLAISGLSTAATMAIVTGVYAVLYLILDYRLKRVGEKRFRELNV